MIDQNRAALVVAALLAGWHALWSAAVALGWAQAIIDFILWMHFIKPVYVVEPFELTRCVVLLGVTGAVGAGFGYCFAAVWNGVHRRAQRSIRAETQTRSA